MLVREDLGKATFISKTHALGISIGVVMLSLSIPSNAQGAKDIYQFDGSYKQGAYYHPDEDRYEMPKLDVISKFEDQDITNSINNARRYVDTGRHNENPYPEVSSIEAPEQAKYILPYCHGEIITDCIPLDEQYIDAPAPVWYGHSPVFGADGSYCRGTEEACTRYEASWQKMIEELHGNNQANS